MDNDGSVADATPNRISSKSLTTVRQMVDSLSKVTQKKQSPLTERFILEVLDDVDATLLDDPTLIDLKSPIIVCGDIHGDYATLIRIFCTNEWVPMKRYLFLGDYVDRGELNLEVIVLLLLLKLLYPKDIYLLRGNHEAPCVNRYYGFKSELMQNRFSKVLWERFQVTFSCLPLAATINGKIFCVHGGISPRMVSLDQIRKIRRPVFMPNDGMLLDLLWADPNVNSRGVEPNELRNASVTFCEKTIENWLRMHNLELIIRAHEVVTEGYELMPGKKLLTIFSCPNYSYGNAAAVAKVDENLCITFVKYVANTRSAEEVSEPSGDFTAQK